MVSIVHLGNTGHEHSYSRTTAINMAHGSSSGPDASVALVAVQVAHISMVPRAALSANTNMASSQAFAQSLMAIGVMDINSDPGYYSAMNPDMAIGSSSVLDVTIGAF